jgi:lysozyme
MNPTYSDVVVDISRWQNVASFKGAEEAGIQAVICKATEGTEHLDPKYLGYASEILGTGLLLGSYHFLQPGNPVAQAQWFAKNLVKPTVIMLDYETKGCTIEQAEQFVQWTADNLGSHGIFYTYEAFVRGMARSEILAACPLNMAKYSTSEPEIPDTWPTWSFWQNSDGHLGVQLPAVPGIGHCDRDRFHRPASDLATWWKAHTIS